MFEFQDTADTDAPTLHLSLQHTHMPLFLLPLLFPSMTKMTLPFHKHPPPVPYSWMLFTSLRTDSSLFHTAPKAPSDLGGTWCKLI